MIVTVTINNNINVIVTTSITININKNSGGSFESMHLFVLRVLVAKEKNWPDRVGGNLNAATLPQQTPPFNCPHPSSLALSWQPRVFVISRISFRKKLHWMNFFFKYYETFFKNWYLTIKAREWTSLSVVYKKSESLCDSCVALTSPRFMVFSRIDNIKYFPHWQSKIRSSRGTGLSNQAAIHKSSSGLWSR